MEKQLQNPATIKLKAPGVSDVDNKIALRRTKVKELMRMGYNAQQISIALRNGIILATGEVITVPCSESAIKKDIKIILQEEAAADTEMDLSSKKADIREKLRYLYNQAIREYREEKSRGLAKNAFLNTALSVLKQIIELEGINNFKTEESQIEKENKVLKLSDEINSLKKEEKDAIVGAINQILGNGDEEGSGGSEIFNTASRISTQAGNNAGIS